MSQKIIKTTQLLLIFLLFHIVSYSNSLPLSTSSRWIIDQENGNRVKLTCTNWVSHLDPMLAEGLEKKPLNFIVSQIASSGFNCVRFTWPTFMFTRPAYGSLTASASLDKHNLTSAKEGIGKNNPQFLDMNVVDVHKAVVDELGKQGLMVVLDNHISEPKWCCSGRDGNGFFGDPSFDPNEWLQGLTAVARTYKGNPAVVAMSMRNELRGDRQNEADWYKYMQQGADAIHRENPDVLAIVSGLNYDTNLRFLNTRPLLQGNLDSKLVYEAHWYSFGDSAERWSHQTNHMCASVTQGARNNYLYLTNNGFPVFLSEFGINQGGRNVADNRYIGCFLAAVAEADIDWALWTFQGSYMLREGQVNMEETYGVMDLNWDGPRNPSFLERLQLLRQINQEPKSSQPTYYKMYHPQSGRCVNVLPQGEIVLSECKSAARWDQHVDNGPIKLVGSLQCLNAAGDNAAVRVSDDCAGNGAKWKFSSSSGLHLASHDVQGRFLCLEANAADLKLVTKKCLCVGDDLVDFPSCNENPEVQWFKLVPSNV